MQKSFRYFTVALLCAGTLLTRPAYAEVIEKIQVIGNQRIEEETILSYMRLPENSEITQTDINNALKQLFQTNLFNDITINQKGNTLVVNVDENPVINKIAFEGNKRMTDDDLRKEVTLQPRAVYTQSKVQNDVSRLLDIYQKSGRFSVEIEPKVVKLDQNRVDLVFEIDEGKKSSIRNISFIGNNAFSDKKLEKVIQTKETRWYRFFSGDSTYDADRLAFDQEMLRKHYISNGYADFKVVSAVAEITPDKEAFFLTFTLEEGIKYHFGEINVDTKLKNIDIDELEAHARTKAGDVFNAELIETSIEGMVQQLSDQGYAFVDITPKFNRLKKDGLINITYEIKEGPKVYVERININGNVRTLDKVIRREFRIVEGDPYNAAQIRRSQQRIRNLGFFDKVDIQTDKGSAGDKADIDVTVSERSTGELNFGAGFSTTEGALVNASIRERNLLGKGQDLRFNVQKATKGLELDVSFTEPYFMDKDIAVGFDVFKITRDRESESSFDSDSNGLTLRGSYSVTEYLRHTLRYSLRSDDITNISSDASLFIRAQEGKNTTSLVGHTLMLDKRNNRFEPTEGYSVRFNQDFAGLGGDSQFIRNELRADYYTPLVFEELILQLGAKSGYIFGINDEDVRINERFFVGANEIRGFRRSGIGPRDNDTRDALGGNLYYTATTELNFPIGLPEELGVRGAAFVDAGSLSETDDSGPQVLDENSIRVSAGVGLSWKSPLGPIRIDFANPLVKESFDRTQQVRFSFGTRF